MEPQVKFINDFPPAAEYKYDEGLWNRQHGNAFVIINCRATNIYYPEHWTPLSLKCAFNGKEFYKLRNTTYAVTDQNFLVMNQGSEYASYILSDSVTESFTLNFTQHNLHVLSTVIGRNSLQLLDDPFRIINGNTAFVEKLYPYNSAVLSYIQQLKNYAAAGYADSLRITELLYSLLEEVFQLNTHVLKEAENISAKKKGTREELYKRLSTGKDFLDSCYGDEITLDRLAEACYMNPFYLLREFKKLFSITPHQYLTRVRLKEAEKLISNTDRKIIDVLHETGFEDPTSFSRLFKKQYGATPTVYRNQRKKNSL